MRSGPLIGSATHAISAEGKTQPDDAEAEGLACAAERGPLVRLGAGCANESVMLRF